MKRNLVLIGMPGVGKTQAGRLAARSLGWDFVDTDQVITSRAGRSIEDIFAQEGEAAFRAMEREALRWACAGQERVIGAGGGSFIYQENRALMLEAGLVVCLEASPELIRKRLSSSSGSTVRPLLQGADPLQRIKDLKSARQPCYDMAHCTLSTEGLSLREVAAKLVDAWKTAERDAETTD